jgi:hypothetical protein
MTGKLNKRNSRPIHFTYILGRNERRPNEENFLFTDRRAIFLDSNSLQHHL